MNTFLRDHLLPILRSLSRASLISYWFVFSIFFLFAILPYLFNDPQAQAITATLTAIVVPWIVALLSVFALSRLVIAMIRTWLEDHREVSPNR